MKFKPKTQIVLGIVLCVGWVSYALDGFASLSKQAAPVARGVYVGSFVGDLGMIGFGLWVAFKGYKRLRLEQQNPPVDSQPGN